MTEQYTDYMDAEVLRMKKHGDVFKGSEYETLSQVFHGSDELDFCGNLEQVCYTVDCDVAWKYAEQYGDEDIEVIQVDLSDLTIMRIRDWEDEVDGVNNHSEFNKLKESGKLDNIDAVIFGDYNGKSGNFVTIMLARDINELNITDRIRG